MGAMRTEKLTRNLMVTTPKSYLLN